MTKAETTAFARRARQYGYFKSGNTLALNCPECRARQSTEPAYRTFKAPKGKPANVDPVTGARTNFRLERDVEALDRMMIDHLAWCGTDRSV